MKTLHAYTEATGYKDYPSYVNLSEDDGKAVLTVRGRDSANSTSAQVPESELLALADAIYARFAVAKTMVVPTRVANANPAPTGPRPPAPPTPLR